MAITQSEREAGVTTPLGPDVLLLTSMTGYERLGHPFRYELELLSEQPTIPFNKIVGQKLTVWLRLPGGGRRFFNGYVSRFTSTGIDTQGRGSYRAVLVPWLWLLTRTQDCRTYVPQSARQTIAEVFDRNSQTDFEFKLEEEYTPIEFCVQYRETDFAFVSRLMEHEGMYYFFEHTDGHHKMVLADHPSKHVATAGYESIIYRQQQDTREWRECITDWRVEQKLQPGSYTLRDYNFEVPRTDLTKTLAMEADHSESAHAVYDYPGEYGTASEGEHLVKVRMEQEQAEQEMIEAESNVRGIATGATFKLAEHPDTSQEREYLITGVNFRLRGILGELGGADGGATFGASFTAIAANRQFRPSLITPRPVIAGPQTATVVGPKGEEIWTDSHGRVLVQFHWDRVGQRNEKSSCWLRVAQLWAGKGWGALHIPRIGQEVIVEFLEGNPDNPIVTGRLYNGANPPPFDLPGGATRSGVLSRSTKNGAAANANEFSFEDLKGSEQILLHAERNYDIVVESDESHRVGHDRVKTIGHDETTTVQNNRTETVAVDHSETIGANMTVTVGSSLTETVALNYAETVGVAMEVTVGAAYALTVGASFSEAVGASRSATVGGSSSETVGSNKTLTVSKDLSETISGSHKEAVTKEYSLEAKKVLISAEDEIAFKTGSAEIVLKKNGDILIKGNKIQVKGDGDVIIKGSKVTNN